jgi:hypothetical protein
MPLLLVAVEQTDQGQLLMETPRVLDTFSSKVVDQEASSILTMIGQGQAVVVVLVATEQTTLVRRELTALEVRAELLLQMVAAVAAARVL